MFPSYDMNPIAQEKMRRERLETEWEPATRMRPLIFGAAALVLLVLLGAA